MGVSPATGPTPNRGYEAAGLQKLGIVLKLLTDTLPLVGANSEMGQEILKILPRLSKMVPAGSTTPAGERNGLENMMLANQQNNQQMQMLRQQMAQQGGQQQARPAPQPMAA